MGLPSPVCASGSHVASAVSPGTQKQPGSHVHHPYTLSTPLGQKPHSDVQPDRLLGQVPVVGQSGAAIVICTPCQCSLPLQHHSQCIGRVVSQCSLNHACDTGIKPCFVMDLSLCKPVSSLRQPLSAPLLPVHSRNLDLTLLSGTLFCH